ncbi:acyl-CoA dehydrogenase [Parashewanella curva]|uniref:Acyl-CoA dehydrogenase n=1 Tax=Parashewanella curva TaxID=2338552 RepID=A0A3L8PV70_9GAMM|nr:acyl-CoA dehydrogenase family protein [Parashewanella curva]RLV58473.1 acyl-CoA dehydrogenase [Parashewanella curva]
MYPYNAPINEMNFLLKHVFKAEENWQQFPFIQDNLDLDTAMAILEEASKFSSEQIKPINANGDKQGISLENGKVITPNGYKDVYKDFAEGGWVGFCGNPEYEGMGMPKMLGVCVDEMNYSACNAFALYNSLTAGAALCINAHASEALKHKYLPKLYSGEWSGAMAMTESGAGSDLRHIRTYAKHLNDESYSITGTKIFITAGEHDLTSNIIHLVLAKIKNSDKLSLFLVPKLLVNEQGDVSEPNNVAAMSVEHKMGIHGSATCVMNYDNSVGYLIGEEDKGLACMFTMMNYERLSIGIQGLANGEMAYQLASQYAKEREQGSTVSATGEKVPSCMILQHGDIRRMLLTIKTLTDAGRALAIFTGLQLDRAHYLDEQSGKQSSRFAQLLTPVTKAFFSDRGLECSILGQQVFGGHGYIWETGAEQLVRDSRIAQIYEGTNGIQANDFLSRKILADDLSCLKEFIGELRSNISSFTNVPSPYISQLNSGFDQLINTAESIQQRVAILPAAMSSCSVNYLDAFGYCIYGYFWLEMLHHSDEVSEDFRIKKAYFCEFYFDQLFPKSNFHLQQLENLDSSMLNIPEDCF